MFPGRQETLDEVPRSVPLHLAGNSCFLQTSFFHKPQYSLKREELHPLKQAQGGSSSIEGHMLGNEPWVLEQRPLQANIGRLEESGFQGVCYGLQLTIDSKRHWS